VIIENNHCYNNTAEILHMTNAFNMAKLLRIEIHSYPNKSQITYKEEGRTFHYTVLKEGFYPNKKLLKFTRKPNSFPLPDIYEVITTWGRRRNQHAVKCSINYEIPSQSLEYTLAIGLNGY